MHDKTAIFAISILLRFTDNEKELFAFLSREVITIQTDKLVFSSLLEDVICRQEKNTEGLSPCSHEDAETLMMVLVVDTATQCNSVSDSDVVVILAVYVCALLTSSLNALWIAFSTGKN